MVGSLLPYNVYNCTVQLRRSGCSTCAVSLFSFARNIQKLLLFFRFRISANKKGSIADLFSVQSSALRVYSFKRRHCSVFSVESVQRFRPRCSVSCAVFTLVYDCKKIRPGGPERISLFSSVILQSLDRLRHFVCTTLMQRIKTN